MGRPLKINISQHKEIIDLYLNKKLSLNKISEKFNVNTETIRNILIKNNIIRRTISESNIEKTKFTFKDMSADKAFLLGIIYGDGSLSKKGDYFNITTGDYDLIEKSKLILGEKFKEYKKTNSCYLGVFCSKKVSSELRDIFHLTNNKSDKLVFPDLPNELMKPFISGYLATDGCIHINKKDNLLVLSFYSCSKNFLEDLNKYICNNIDITKRTLYKRTNFKDHIGNKPLYTLVFNGIKAEKACSFIFENSYKNIRSDRKYLIYKLFTDNKVFS